MEKFASFVADEEDGEEGVEPAIGVILFWHDDLFGVDVFIGAEVAF